MNTAVIIPSLNPDEKLIQTVKGLLREGFSNLVVVDDGSDDHHRMYFEELQKLPGVVLLKHETNRGKGRAMKTAFSYVLEHLPDLCGVVTVDGDGQHLPKDICACVKRMEEVKSHVILGVRDFSKMNVPLASRFGNKLTRAVFRLFCGISITDTQTGLRAIPREYLTLMLDIPGERYEYETNQLLTLKKEQITMEEVVIETVYIDDNRASHFHPIRDSLKIYEVILKFSVSALSSFLVDIGLFTLLNLLLKGALAPETRLLIATVTARLVSSMVNFTMNKRYVFRSRERLHRALLRYYTLCVCQTALSYGLVYLVASMLLHLNGSLFETVVKLAVDLCLFFISFQIQQRWVF